MSGFVFYDGPSLIDGAPIVAIAVLESENGKTATMKLYTIATIVLENISELNHELWFDDRPIARYHCDPDARVGSIFCLQVFTSRSIVYSSRWGVG
jgi:hypothetical protein